MLARSHIPDNYNISAAIFFKSLTQVVRPYICIGYSLTFFQLLKNLQCVRLELITERTLIPCWSLNQPTLTNHHIMEQEYHSHDENRKQRFTSHETDKLSLIKSMSSSESL